MVRTALYGLLVLWVSPFWAYTSGKEAWASEADQLNIQFVRKIQPILITTCASSGCHGSDSTRSFRLDRLAVEGAGHAGLIRQNLAHVLRQIGSADRPSDSFLKYAMTTHGSRDHPFKPLKPRQLQLLKSWIRSIPAKNQPQVMKSSDVVTEEIDRPVLEKQSGVVKSQQGLLRHSDPHQVRKLRLGVRLSQFEPRDPFDAEIFNRRVASTVESRQAIK